LIENTSIEAVYDITHEVYLKDAFIYVSGKIKSVLINHKRVLPVYLKENQYVNCIKEQLRKY